MLLLTGSTNEGTADHPSASAAPAHAAEAVAIAAPLSRDSHPTSLALPLIRRLCDALDKQGVRYCHWKSNWKLDNWVKGEGDLDFLIARSDATRFMSTVSQLGFKQAVPPRDRQVPGILSYYDFDATSGRFVHLHAHYQLVLGHDFTKNYHLPIERAFLGSAVRQDLVPVPESEFELIVFVLRMVLKFTVPQSLLRKTTTSLDSELAYLESRSSRGRVDELLEQHLPFVGAAFFDQCIQSLRPGCPLWTRLLVRQQLHRRLRAHARTPQPADALLKIGRRVTAVVRAYVLRKPTRRRFPTGGAMIAIVGGDGAGKSTAVSELHRWLSTKFAAKKVHLGKPPWSLTAFAVRATLKITEWFATIMGKQDTRPSPAPPVTRGFPGYLHLLRRVCTARDRYRAYVGARRFASNGGIVICDRYPLGQVKLMDGLPPDPSYGIEAPNALVRFLIRKERGLYALIPPPDVLIVLRVPPDVAVQRRTDENAASVRARCEEVWRIEWEGTGAHVVDAARPAEDVLAELRSIVWSQL